MVVRAGESGDPWIDGGNRRGEHAYVWPTNLIRPSDVKLIYLDQNHWVSLAKAASGHRHGREYAPTLARLRQARESGAYVFPLSATHYMETAPIRNGRRRTDVERVMSEIAGMSTLISRSVVMRLEVEAALDAFGRSRSTPYAPVQFVGHGPGHALGMRGGFRIRSDDGRDVTDDVRASYPGGRKAFDELLEDAHRRLNTSLLRGPVSDDEESELRADGWDPDVSRRIAVLRATAEAEQATRMIDPLWRKQRVRDVVSARHVFIELNETLAEGLHARGLDLTDVFGDPDDPNRDPENARRVVDVMPSSDVGVSLTVAAHRSPDTKWTPNRIMDIDALSVAVAYCDVVVTDSEASHTLHSEGIAQRLETHVTARIQDLADLIDI